MAIDDCLIHHPNITEALDGIQRALDAAGAGQARGLRLTAHPSRRELLWQPVGGASPPALQAAMAQALPEWLVQQDSISLEYDRAMIDGVPGTVMFRVDSETFVQVNHEMAHRLYGLALRYLGDSPGALVEGYAGFGAMSALAGSRPDESRRPTRLTLVEENRAAATLARLHMRLHGVEGSTVLAGRLEDRLALLEPEEVDSVIVDPPRAGCTPKVIRELARLQPERLVYVSCDPATLARDLQALGLHGYQVAAQTLVDMFPQTYHVETVNLIQKGVGGGGTG